MRLEGENTRRFLEEMAKPNHLNEKQKEFFKQVKKTHQQRKENDALQLVMSCIKEGKYTKEQVNELFKILQTRREKF